MKVLVIGGSGYLGSHVLEELRGRNHNVAGLARSESAKAKMRSRNFESISCDLLNKSVDYKSIFEDFDAIIFAPQLMIPEENELVSRILKALEHSNKTFIFTSGTGVVAQRTDGLWSEESFAEDDEFVPCKYLALRVDTENAVRAASEHGIRSMVIRPPSIWGEGGGDLLKNFFVSAAKTGTVCYLGKGLNLYCHVHVRDLAHLFALAIENGTAGALYHAVAGELNNRSIAEAVAKHLGLQTRSVDFEEGDAIWGRFGVLIAMSMSSRTRCPRSRNELGWSAKHVDLIEEIPHPAFVKTLQEM